MSVAELKQELNGIVEDLQSEIIPALLSCKDNYALLLLVLTQKSEGTNAEELQTALIDLEGCETAIKYRLMETIDVITNIKNYINRI